VAHNLLLLVMKLIQKIKDVVLYHQHIAGISGTENLMFLLPHNHSQVIGLKAFQKMQVQSVFLIQLVLLIVHQTQMLHVGAALLKTRMMTAAQTVVTITITMLLMLMLLQMQHLIPLTPTLVSPTQTVLQEPTAVLLVEQQHSMDLLFQAHQVPALIQSSVVKKSDLVTSPPVLNVVHLN